MARYFGSVATARRREHRCLVCLEYVSKGLWQIGLKVQEVTFRLDPSFFPWDVRLGLVVFFGFSFPSFADWMKDSR